MKRIILFISILCSCYFTSCSTKQTESKSSENPTEYEGIYKGTYPAADCPGINIALSLDKNKTYSMTMNYIDRNSEFTEKGSYQIKDSLLSLQSDQEIQYYKIMPDSLIKLDANREPLTGGLAKMFVLRKDDNKRK